MGLRTDNFIWKTTCKWYLRNRKSMQECPSISGLLKTTTSSRTFGRTIYWTNYSSVQLSDFGLFGNLIPVFSLKCSKPEFCLILSSDSTSRKFENELTQLAEPTEQEIRQMREEIEEAKKEKSPAFGAGWGFCSFLSIGRSFLWA